MVHGISGFSESWNMVGLCEPSWLIQGTLLNFKAEWCLMASHLLMQCVGRKMLLCMAGVSNREKIFITI